MDKVNDTNYIQEDEIDLRELWQTIINGKKIRDNPLKYLYGIK